MEMKTPHQTNKMITRIENSSLNKIPISRIGHIGSLRILEWVMRREVSEAAIRSRLKRLEKKYSKLEKQHKKMICFSSRKEANYLILEGMISALKWYIGESK
jgi:hypothetical protein